MRKIIQPLMLDVALVFSLGCGSLVGNSDFVRATKAVLSFPPEARISLSTAVSNPVVSTRLKISALIASELALMIVRKKNWPSENKRLLEASFWTVKLKLISPGSTLVVPLNSLFNEFARAILNSASSASISLNVKFSVVTFSTIM